MDPSWLELWNLNSKGPPPFREFLSRCRKAQHWALITTPLGIAINVYNPAPNDLNTGRELKKPSTADLPQFSKGY
jgi:hypothetical protein